MGRQYKERREDAMESVAKWCDKHVLVEEPVRSFRFHSHYVEKKVEKGRVEHRPGFVTFLPTAESAKFKYTSTYCFTLTWTPGHMTIVGDLGELTVVHYHAMPTLEAACNWLQSSDYDYLLSKTGVQRQYDGAQTYDGFKRLLNDEVIEHAIGRPGHRWIIVDGERKAVDRWQWGDIEEKRAWRKQQPRGGQLNEEDENLFEWFDAKPSDPFSDIDRYCWDRWKQAAKAVGFPEDSVLTARGRRAILSWIKGKFEQEQLAAEFMWSAGFEDPYMAYEYPHQAFVQIAAIQFGVKMIMQQLEKERKQAA
ncbi:hypothetical protein J2J97_32505 (plasmid) [Rhizobium bangladeshense]|uniref:hypothetical protein n=1 Tax=Rhizobium bangladeshense TaxID=1138189 RepID=UPI001A98D2CB|nr:hypothetical protein [Rhizobium bangladeshense]QSY98627.1 hypothetical protein J2J97_32505 [Rhizobium bangladeshense]